MRLISQKSLFRKVGSFFKTRRAYQLLVSIALTVVIGGGPLSRPVWSSQLSPSLLQNADSVSLEVSPKIIWKYSQGWGQVRYLIRIAKPGSEICTGWLYPVVQWHIDQWPARISCRTVDRNIIEETWGGARYPLPYVGEYRAFVSYQGVVVTQKFIVLEGIPSMQ